MAVPGLIVSKLKYIFALENIIRCYNVIVS